MNITLTHTELFDFTNYEFRSGIGEIAPYYAIKLKDEDQPQIFTATEDDEYRDFLLLLLMDGTCLDYMSVNEIEAWEPIWDKDFKIKDVN